MCTTKNKLISLLCSLCMLLSLFTVFPASSFAVSIDNPIQQWTLLAALQSGTDLNGSAYTGRCSVWQINVEKDATTGDFMRMTHTSDGYVDASGEDLTHAKFSSKDKDAYVSPGLNGATGKEAHVAYGFTVPETGTYVLEVTFTTYPSWGSDWVPKADSAPYFYTMVRSENVAEEDVELKKQSEFTFDVNGAAAQTNVVTVQLKAGETVYYVSAANGEALHDKGYYRTFNVYHVNRDYTEPEEEEVVTPPPALDTYWSLADYNYLQTDLNSDTSTAPMSIWQRNIEKGATTGEFMKMNFNGAKKYSDASGENLSGACLEDMHFCPGMNGATGKEANVGIAFTAPTDGTYELYVNMKKSWLPAIDPDSPPRYYTMKGQDGAEENVFFYDDPTGAALEKTITFELKKGETLYFFCDTDGSRTDRKDDIYLSALKVTLTSYEITETPEEPTADYTASLGTTYQEVTENEDVTFTVTADKAFASGEVVLTYDPSVLTFKSSTAKAHKAENGTLTLETYGMDDATTIDVVFTAVAVAESTTVTLAKAAFSTATEAETSDLTAATVGTASASVAVLADTYTVVLGDNLATLQGQTGSVTVANGTALSFKVADTYTALYKDIVVKAGEEVLTAVEGVYTIDYAATVTVTGTPKTFTVTVEGDDYALVTVDPEEPTYLTPFKVTLPDNKSASLTDNGYTYSAKITIGGVDYAVVTEKVTTIAGDKITGDVVITVTKTEVPKTGVSVTVTGEVAVAGDYARTATKGEAYTLTITPAAGYAYTVTAQVNGVAVELAKDGNKYTVAAADVTGDITFEITAEVASEGLTVDKYLTLDGDNDLWLVKMVGDLADGKVYKYGDTVLVWSDNYDAYVCLVLSADEPALELTIVDGDLSEIEYTNDINGTEVIDANDAQLVYNMYNSTYTDFTTVSMMKFLLADVNADSTVDVQDAAAIVNAILGNA